MGGGNSGEIAEDEGTRVAARELPAAGAGGEKGVGGVDLVRMGV